MLAFSTFHPLLDNLVNFFQAHQDHMFAVREHFSVSLFFYVCQNFKNKKLVTQIVGHQLKYLNKEEKWEFISRFVFKSASATYYFFITIILCNYVLCVLST